MELFTDLNSEFKLLDYVPSHCQLLIRSMRNRRRDYNIDIIFKSVSALFLPTTTLKGLTLSVVQLNADNNFLIETLGFEIKWDQIFALKDASGKEYFIIAGSVGVFHNKLDILETSIGMFKQGADWGEKLFWYKGDQ